LVIAAAVLFSLVPAGVAHGRNPQIAGLQVALRSQGYYCGTIDGIAGPATAAAVRKLQRHARLPVTGIADARTRRALGPLGTPVLGRRPLARGAYGLDVSALQFLLDARKLSPGPLDGIFDTRTDRALRRFQRTARLRVDGVAGPNTIAALARPGTPVVLIQPAARPHPRITTTRYVVKAGDSLSAIAAAHGTTVKALARLNGLRPSKPLLIGTHLRVPGGRRVTSPRQAARSTVKYVVRPGDSLSALAAAHGLTTTALARLNGLRPSALIVIGQTIRLPGTARPVPRATPIATVRYVVRAGDSLSAIAAAYATTVGALARLNGLRPADILQAGAVIRLPASAVAKTAKPVRIAADAGVDVSADVVRASIEHWSAVYQVDAGLARALAWQESGYQTNLTSVSGAWGVMQILPVTWDYVETVLIGATVPRTADGNVRIGVAYLASLLTAFNGDERLALGAWYQGAQAVRDGGLLPETKLFVANVLALRGRV
jgi:LysM repeat protein